MPKAHPTRAVPPPRYKKGAVSAAPSQDAGTIPAQADAATSEEAPAEPEVTTVWQPDPKEVEKLPPETSVLQYFLRPPPDCAFIPTKGLPPGTAAQSWASNRRKDRTRGQFSVMVVPVSRFAKETLEKEVEDSVALNAEGMAQFESTEMELGLINGLLFARVRWSGTTTDTNQARHGFIYVAYDELTFIKISAEDVEPHHTNELVTAEAAALTFRK